MAPKVPKKGKPAPTSKKPVVRNAAKAAKSAANKAQYAAVQAGVRAHVEATKASARAELTPLEPFSGWTEDLDKALYKLIATGNSMRDIAKIEGMPSLVDMLTWLTEDTHPFSKTYARGKQAVVAMFEEDIQTIALTSNDYSIKTFKQTVTKDGDVVDFEEERVVDNVERSKLAVATMQWTLSHLKPKKHGRSPEQTSNGPNEQLKGLFESLKAPPVDK
jgi:hypothetical protein